MRVSTPVYIGIGSNISPEENIPEALRKLIAAGLVSDRKPILISNHYETPAIGKPEDPQFINGVWHFATLVSFKELKAALNAIESELGRKRVEDPYAPREIDLDILLFGALIDKKNKLPDPDIYKRKFVYLPLLELSPDLRIPGDEKPLAEIVDTAQNGMVVSPLTEKLKQIALEEANEY